MTGFFHRHKLIILYALALGVVLFLLKYFELRFMVIKHSVEIYIGIIAVIFTSLGIWLALKLAKPKVERVEVIKEIRVSAENFVFNEKESDRLGLSKREIEVLEFMAQGLSNQEIADKMFVSLNTIKTHTSNLFSKLDVKRRTAAVEEARKLGLVR